MTPAARVGVFAFRLTCRRGNDIIKSEKGKEKSP